MTNGERFPPLETLKIEEYPWGFVPGDDDNEFWFQDYPAAVQEPEYWVTQCDWSRLSHLDFNTAWEVGSKDAMLPALLAPHLSSLRSVKIRSTEEIVFSFFSNLPSSARLESVTVCFLPRKLETLLSARYGDSIADVTLRNQQPIDSELRDIARHFPGLRSLNFSSTRITHQALRGTQDEAFHEFTPSTFAILASEFPCLRELTISFPELGEMERPHKPFLTREKVSQIFGSLFLPGNKLSRVDISTGELGTRVIYGYAPQAHVFLSWNKRNSIGFVGERKVEWGGDSESGRVGFRVRCSQLSWLWNERLERILEGNDKDNLKAWRKRKEKEKENSTNSMYGGTIEQKDGVPGPFWVALEGPTAGRLYGRLPKRPRK